MRTIRRIPTGAALVALLAGTFLTAPTATAAPATATNPSGYREYVALGDSWSADVVLVEPEGLPATTYVPIDWAQSNRNYPKLVARTLQVPRFYDATCGAATTDHFFAPQTNLPLGGTNRPQFDHLTSTTDLVTVGIGGNDAGFSAAALRCFNILPINIPALVALPPLPFELPLLGSSLPIGGCKHLFVRDGRDLLAEQIAASEAKVVRALREIHRRSPRARVLLVNYLDAIPAKGCYPIAPLSNTDVAYLHQTFMRLNAMLTRAAKKGGAELVDVFTASRGHDACQPPTQRYVEAIGIISLNGPSIAVPAHPNSAGAAQQYRSVMAQLTKPALRPPLRTPRKCAVKKKRATRLVANAKRRAATKKVGPQRRQRMIQKARVKGQRQIARACVRGWV